MSELYERTFKRLAEIEKMGYNVEYIWEHGFEAKMRKDKEYKKVIENRYPYCDSIDSMEALSGGRCNAIKMSRKTVKRKSSISIFALFTPMFANINATR